VGNGRETVGEVGRPFIGYEKLIEFRLLVRSSSGTVDNGWDWRGDWLDGDRSDLSTLIPRPSVLFVGEELNPTLGSRLTERRPGFFRPANPGGMEGRGGTASTWPLLVAGRRGDCSRNVLLLMELELLLRRRAVLLAGRRLPVMLLCEVTEARL
jgi:hypothetical protein